MSFSQKQPVKDHGLLNPTYLEALVWEGQRYQNLFLSPLGQMAGQRIIWQLQQLLSERIPPLAASVQQSFLQVQKLSLAANSLEETSILKLNLLYQELQILLLNLSTRKLEKISRNSLLHIQQLLMDKRTLE